MNLSQFLNTIENSSPEDWYKSPTYEWKWGNLAGFETLAVYKGDIDISVVLPGTIRVDYVEPWMEAFAVKTGALIAVLLRYKGEVIKVWEGLLVDTGRYFLPVPHSDEILDAFVNASELPLAKLFFTLYGHVSNEKNLEGVLARAGIRIVDDLTDNTEETTTEQ